MPSPIPVVECTQEPAMFEGFQQVLHLSGNRFLEHTAFNCQQTPLDM